MRALAVGAALISSLWLIGWSVFPPTINKSNAIIKFEESIFSKGINIFYFAPHKDELLAILNKGVVIIRDHQWYGSMSIGGWSDNGVTLKFSMRENWIGRFKNVDLLSSSTSIGRRLPVVFYDGVSQESSMFANLFPLDTAIILVTDISAQLSFGRLFGAENKIASREPKGKGKNHQERVGYLEVPSKDGPVLGSLLSSIACLWIASLIYSRSRIAGVVLGFYALFGLAMGVDLWSLIMAIAAWR